MSTLAKTMKKMRLHKYMPFVIFTKTINCVQGILVEEVKSWHKAQNSKTRAAVF